MMALGACREPNPSCLPFPSLPCQVAPCPWPWHALRGAGCWPGGPARPNRLPAHTRGKLRSPSCLSGVALGPRAPARRELLCQLGCGRRCWRGKGSSAREGKASRGGWQHQHPFWGLPLLRRGLPDLFSCWCLESQGFSLQNRLGAGAAVPASHAPVQPSLPHTLPLPREPTSFLPSAPLPGSKLPPLPVLQTLFSSEIRSSPAALYESHRRQKEAE